MPIGTAPLLVVSLLAAVAMEGRNRREDRAKASTED
jgi:hypothetical protein